MFFKHLQSLQKDAFPIGHLHEIQIISLADTIGVSTPENINILFETLIPKFPDIEFGAHLHSTPATIEEKVAAAYGSGCRRMDGAIKGYMTQSTTTLGCNFFENPSKCQLVIAFPDFVD